MKQLIFIISFLTCISFSSLYANSGFAVKFANFGKSKQQTVILSVSKDQSRSGDGYLYHDYDYSHKLVPGFPYFLKPTQPSYGFRATSQERHINIRFALTIGTDNNTSATFILASNLNGYADGVTCLHQACQNYGISANRHEIIVWGKAAQ